MADQISSDVAMVEVVREGERWRGYVTQPWFRYFIASNPDGFGTGSGVLHGNPGGAPTWSPVDLEVDVVGVLPAANGGLGGVTGIVGGVLYATGASAYAFTPAGTAHQVLHGGAVPAWGAVDLSADTTGNLDLATRAGGVLAVAHGGTGVTTSTGSGKTVLSDGATVDSLNVTTALGLNGPMTWSAGTGAVEQIVDSDSYVRIVDNLGQSILFTTDYAAFFLVFDKTSGGIAVFFSDPILNVLSPILNTTAGLTFSMSIFHVPQVIVSAGASPRNLSIFVIALKH